MLDTAEDVVLLELEGEVLMADYMIDCSCSLVQESDDPDHLDLPGRGEKTSS